jgi:hypothetical protein
MREINRTKILVQPNAVIVDVLCQKLKLLHHNRDAYLNDILSREIEQVLKEVTAANSIEARKKIDASKFLNRKKLTMTLDTVVADRIAGVLDEKNISRDSFFNRIFFFMVASNSTLDKLGIKYKSKSEPHVGSSGLNVDPFADPFAHIRDANSGCFYTLKPFPDHVLSPSIPNLFALNVAINETDWKLMNPRDEDFLIELTSASNEVKPRSGAKEIIPNDLNLDGAHWRK